MSSLLKDGLNGKMMDAPKEVTSPRIMCVQGKLMEGRDQFWKDKFSAIRHVDRGSIVS